MNIKEYIENEINGLEGIVEVNKQYKGIEEEAHKVLSLLIDKIEEES